MQLDFVLFFVGFFLFICSGIYFFSPPALCRDQKEILNYSL